MSSLIKLGQWTVYITLFVLSGTTLHTTTAIAQTNSPPSKPPVAIAVETDVIPKLDGEVLKDPAWDSAKIFSSFWQNAPDEGQPASEKTEVRILYTADTIYFGVVCYDSDPNSIIVTDSMRDSFLDETDSFQIILDTYLDRNNGFVFGTNPAGIEFDGQVVNEGAGSGFGRQSGARNMRQTTQRGSGAGFNKNWDGSWEVQTLISAIGWSAEFAIPTRTLRFPSKNPQTWGLNFQRNIRKRNETAFWSPLPRAYNIYRVSWAGTLVGLELSTPRNLKFIPYALGEFTLKGNQTNNTNWLGNVGAELKYSITPSLTLDMTYNTDFAQVEVDEQQINLDRFDLFFPEKRPFFLENAGLFSVGSPQEIELFFSRRIGIGSDGQMIPILGGARLSGDVSGLKVGLLNMQTEQVGTTTPANNFTVARARRELPNRSYIGGLFVNRSATSTVLPAEDNNQTFAIDGRLGYGKYGELLGFVAKTRTPGKTGKQHAYKFGTFYDSGVWLFAADYTEVGKNFDPQVGFLKRESFRKPRISIFHRYRPENFLAIQELRPHTSYVGFWDFEGIHESGRWHIDNHVEWKSGDEIHTGMNFTKETLTENFEIFPGIIVPPGTYEHTEAQMVAFTNQAAPISLRTRFVWGGYFGGNRVQSIGLLKFRLSETFNTEISVEHNDIDLPVGNFETVLGLTRISYSFTPKVFIQSLIQYNDRADTWATNFRFGWLQTANVGLFVVYNDTRAQGAFAPDPAMNLVVPDRSLTVKFGRMFDLLN